MSVRNGDILFVHEPERLIEFGSGQLIVTVGTHAGRPCVFIERSMRQGKVGDHAQAVHPHLLMRGAAALTFPTEAQAKAVADALCNADGFFAGSLAASRANQVRNSAIKESNGPCASRAPHLPEEAG